MAAGSSATVTVEIGLVGGLGIDEGDATPPCCSDHDLHGSILPERADTRVVGTSPDCRWQATR